MTGAVENSIAPIRDTAAQDELVRWLRDGMAFEPNGGSVECVETHISWVFLTRRYAYKLKKAVHYDFVDFREPLRRWEACRSELLLNRRLAARVYLGVVPITREAGGGLRLNGGGTPLDWLVHMRRLPADAALDRLLAEDRLRPDHVQRLADRLAQFYHGLPPWSVRTESYRESILRHALANRLVLAQPEHELDAAAVARQHAAQLRLLRLAPDLLDARAADGRLVEGHGDLRPEHVYFAPEPLVIDAVEFAVEYRRADVLDELCFLAMECDLRGAAAVGREVIRHYSRASGDYPPQSLVPFYKTYRASVHAKVSALRAGQDRADARGETARARRYLELADDTARQLGPPLLVVFRGLAGSGKSTLAACLRESLAIQQLTTDGIRRELFDARLVGGPGEIGKPRDDRYRPEHRDRVYAELFRRAARGLEQAASVVLDGTFLREASVRHAMRLARRCGASLLVVECQCPRTVAIERIVRRRADPSAVSEATAKVYDSQAKEREPLPAGVPAVAVSTTRDPAQVVQQLLERLRILPPLDDIFSPQNVLR